MKARDFRALVEQLGDISQVQRDALVEALTAKGSGDQVIALIEMRFAAAPACGHCGSNEFEPWGSASDLKRYMCRTCERTFNALTGTPLAGLRLREKWLDYARSLVDGISLRKGDDAAIPLTNREERRIASFLREPSVKNAGSLSRDS